MAMPPRPMGSLTDSGIEAPEGMNVEVPQVDDFAGGAEVMQEADGSALVQALMGGLEDGDGMMVETEQYDHGANLAEVIDEAVLGEISGELRGMYEEDLESRGDWEQAYTKGLDLLGIGYSERSEPFEGASGVTHPLIAESVTQFQAQSYKELLPAGGPVSTQVIGTKTPEKEAQAARVKNFMNYQITEVMEEFDPDTDQMLFYLPLSGSTFKKVYFDFTKNRAVSAFVPAEDLVVPYSATDLATAPRVTHVLRMDSNQVRKMQVAGVYRDVEIIADDDSEDPVRDKVDEIEGISKGYTDDVHTILEFHIDLDLEGFEAVDAQGEPTGIKLPYIVTLDHGSGEVLSITRNYDQNDPARLKRQYFVHYKFLPGLGFYGFGLIHMIGGLGRAATSILRQLIDAGTLANLPSGFKARGIRIRNEDDPLSPGEFRDIDAPGGDIRNSIIPLPFKEPSGTLANLLGSLIEGGRRFVSIADQQIGESGGRGDMPVGTTVALLERGMKVMSAIHKRLHYAQKTEFRLLSRIFAENLPPVYPYEVAGAPSEVKTQDFDGRVDVLPVSDPNIFSMAQRVTLAQTQLQLAQSNPQIHNLYEAYKRMYQALEVQNIDQILPPRPKPAPTSPSIENAKGLQGEAPIAFQEQDHDAHIQAHILFMKMPIVQTTPNIYAIFVAHIQDHVAMKARLIVMQEIQAEQAEAQQAALAAQMGAIDPMIAQEKMQQVQATDPNMMESRVAQYEARFTQEISELLVPQGQQDPLVAIRQQELAIKAAESERRAAQDAAELDLGRQKLQQKAMADAARIELQEEIAEDRADVNRERIQTQRELAMGRNQQ